MSGEERKILEQLSNGEITPQQAEEELKKLRGRRGFIKSFCDGLTDMDLCFNFGGNGRFTLEEELTGTLDSGPVELNLSTANGSIQVETWDAQEYRLLIKKRIKASTEEEAQEIADQSVYAEISGNKITAGDGCHETRRKVSVSLHLQIPKGHSVEGVIKTANGSIAVSGLTGQGLELSSANGSIRLEDLSGGPLGAKTVNGSIRLEGEISQVKAGTTNGSITLNSSLLSGDTALHTVNGSIRTAIPANPELAFALKASTTCGRVTLDHPRLGMRKIGGWGGKYIETRSDNWDQAAKKVNLDFSTVNGSISIREA